jgi:hypothetical protein
VDEEDSGTLSPSMKMLVWLGIKSRPLKTNSLGAFMFSTTNQGSSATDGKTETTYRR